jgi:glucosamine-6-phosphate deaminase
MIDSMPAPLQSFDQFGLQFHVYETAEDMGKASAISLATEQVRLIQETGTCSIQLMAAPSAFPFYKAYLELASNQEALQQALIHTHYFQFDDYPLPASHPASFRYLLNTHLFNALKQWVPDHQIHLFQAEQSDSQCACIDYEELLLLKGPDLQLKGAGENGHWGFHEPGIPLDGEPAMIEVALSDENVTQQMRDHPDLFPTPESVPKEAFSANVPLFLRTKVLIEDNIPQASKAFAVVAGYGSAKVDTVVPTSALKTHRNGVVRLAQASAKALIEYRERGVVSNERLAEMAGDLEGNKTGSAAKIQELRTVLETMDIRCEG